MMQIDHQPILFYLRSDEEEDVREPAVANQAKSPALVPSPVRKPVIERQETPPSAGDGDSWGDDNSDLDLLASETGNLTTSKLEPEKEGSIAPPPKKEAREDKMTSGRGCQMTEK
jgi:hypothetical protein